MVGLKLCSILVVLVLLTHLIQILEASERNSLDVCKKRASIRCAEEVYISIFKVGDVSDGCCQNLVSLGKACHDALLNDSLGKLQPGVNKALVLARSQKVWDQCVAVTPSPSYSPSFLEKTLEECKKGASIKCKVEVYTSIFKVGDVSDGCCQDLVALGKACHDALVSNSLGKLEPGVNKAVVLAKSQKVWDQCVAVTLSPAYSPSFLEKTLDECKKRASIKCKVEVYTSIFKVGDVSDGCCPDLVALGKACHDALVSNSLGKLEAGVNKSLVLAKSQKVWDQCVAVTLSPAYSPSFLEKTFDECKKRASIKCKVEVYTSIFKVGDVSDGCCQDLVALGKACHDALVSNSLGKLEPGVNKVQVLSKSRQVWNRCVDITVSPESSRQSP